MLSSVLSLFSTNSSASAPTTDYLMYLNNSISFFNEHAFDESSGAYFSEIDNEGHVVSSKIHTVALSRMIYGLAYSSEFFPENLIKAELAAEYLLHNLIGTDEIGKYFISTISNGTIENEDILDIWQQAYGLCGLSELYRVTRDEELLKSIHELHAAFILRFRDSEYGGFFGSYSIKSGQIKGTKTLQSLIYPITAYMANLWGADVSHRSNYDFIIKDHLKIAYQVVWNNHRRWVNVSFADDWRVLESRDGQVVTPGHNFQYASLLLRAKNWKFLDAKEKLNYQNLGDTILSATLKKPIWHNNVIENGFYSEVNSSTDSIVSHLRCWWQHCEAIIALSLAKESFAKELSQLTDFYFANFSDLDKGGDFFYVDLNNKPVISELKGSKGKSTYHVAEMIRFLNEE